MGNFDYSSRKSWYPKPYTAYASCDVTVSGTAVNFSVKDNTTLFDSLTAPYEVLIRNGAEDISIKINSIGNDATPVYGSTDFGTSNLIVSDIFITVSGSSAATLNIFTLGWK